MRPTDTLCSYNGKHGESDWIQYDYFMPVDNTDYLDRRRLNVTMSIVVPPDIAVQIDEQVNKNVYFPDTFFKALYPNTVAPTDLMHDIKREEATQLQIVDFRQKPYKRYEKDVRKYPQPIPY